MLTQVAEGVLVHESDFLRSNAVVVSGTEGVLVVDAGVRGDEIAAIARAIRELGTSVTVGFSTHPHWDHLLWHADLGAVPRYATAQGAAAIQARLSDENWKAMVSGMIPPDVVDQVPLDELFGRVTGLPAGTSRIPWDGPEVRIIEHRAHAPGHAALLIRESGVLVAGDMLSDVLVPVLNVMAPDPIGDYLAALHLLEAAAERIEVVVPGHGSIGDAAELRARIERDRAYVEALRDGRDSDDPRVGPDAEPGWEWVGDLHRGQVLRLAP